MIVRTILAMLADLFSRQMLSAVFTVAAMLLLVLMVAAPTVISVSMAITFASEVTEGMILFALVFGTAGFWILYGWFFEKYNYLRTLDGDPFEWTPIGAYTDAVRHIRERIRTGRNA